MTEDGLSFGRGKDRQWRGDITMLLSNPCKSDQNQMDRDKHGIMRKLIGSLNRSEAHRRRGELLAEVLDHGGGRRA